MISASRFTHLITWGPFWPMGIVIACVCVCVCVCVCGWVGGCVCVCVCFCLCVNFLLVCAKTHHLFKLGSPNRVGQSREIYSNSVPLSPPHWPCPKRIRPPSWPRVAVASSIQNTKLFTWRTWPGAGAVPKYDWAARSQCGSKQRRADHTKYIWYVATHGQSVITTELMIAWIW